MNVKPILELGRGRHGTLNATYAEIVTKIFKPNTTKFDDQDKVKASWGFVDKKGRKGFIWCYKYHGKVSGCLNWSIDGSKELFIEIFGDKVLWEE